MKICKTESSTHQYQHTHTCMYMEVAFFYAFSTRHNCKLQCVTKIELTTIFRETEKDGRANLKNKKH